MLDKLAGPLGDKIKFVKINVDEASRLAKQCQMEVQHMFFKGGKVVDTVVGLPASDELKTRLQVLTQAAKLVQQ